MGDLSIRLPMVDGRDSLHAAVATGMPPYEMLEQGRTGRQIERWIRLERFRTPQSSSDFM